ncbi:transcription initiation factor TFIID component TAF4 [Mycena galopus ATCC 62051]|nr:transcription initiation factor TFIID component TAF4 [Mycena galopus ATCC 62051]
MARQAITNSQNANAGAFDTADVATLNDAIGSAGVDLRAEEESLQRSHQQPQSYSGVFEDRSRKQPPKPHFDAGFLGSTMRAIAARHKLASATPVPDDCVTYLALALRARLQDLVSSMIAAARHRQNAQFDRPVSVYDDGSAAWGVLVRSDVAKQLEALARVERAEEVRAREGREKLERALEKALEAVLNGDVDVEVPNLGEDAMDVDVDRARPKKKAKQAVSEEAGRRMTNAAANRAAGGAPRYAWLAVGTGNGAQRKSKIVADGDAIFGGGGGDAGGGGIDAGADAGATPPPPRPRPYKPSNAITAAPPPLPPDADQRMRVTLRDAMFVIEKERGHGGGRGAARGWT